MYKTILIPIDISEESLIDLVSPHIEFLAKQEDSTIHFISVIPSYSFYSTFGLAYVTHLPDPRDMNEAALKKLMETTNKFKLPEDRIKYHVAVGSPKDQILKLAEAIDADLIIVGSRRPSISRYLLGSTASAIVGYAKTSVMVIR